MVDMVGPQDLLLHVLHVVLEPKIPKLFISNCLHLCVNHLILRSLLNLKQMLSTGLSQGNFHDR